MNVTVESTGALERRMRVEVPIESIENEVKTRLQSVGRTARIKGFRPGKVPARVVRQKYGKQVRQEVLGEIMQKSYTDAVIQENLKPAGGPKIESEGEDDQNFTYVATFEVLPDVTLKNLDKIKVEKPDVDIRDEDLDEMLMSLRRQRATWNEVERKAKNGDRVVIDFSGKLGGEPFEGGTGSDVPVHLGQGQMLPDFEKGLSGMQAGDEKSIKVKFPKDYPAEELAGKKADFAITMHTVSEEVLPELDDEFAAAFNVTEGGLEQFRKDVQENMAREAKQKVDTDIREQVMNQLIEKNPIDVPQALVHDEMHSMQHEAMQRLGIEDHDKAPPMENFREQAEKRVRLGLLLRQVISEQGIAASQDDLRARVEEMCEGYESADEMVGMYMGNPQIMQQVEPMVVEQKAVDWLLENGKSKVKKVRFGDYMNPPAS
ncbi:MAG: trigger factor [Gammaproteobacteria bacterium]|nr:trigger factor [Gammaproteobacteria bacterium]